MRFLSGIAGFVGHGEDRNQLEKMVEVLTHHGPDDTGLRVAPGIGLNRTAGTSENPPELAVIIPAWNERENLELLLPAVREEIARLGITAEIVVVDGGSRDGSREAAERRGARVVPQQVRGYGGALLAGFAATTAPWIVTMDADLSHRPVFLEDFWKRRDEAEVVIASRYTAGGRADTGRLRQLLSLILNRTYRRVLSLPLRDLSSGFRMYRREVLNGLTLQA